MTPGPAIGAKALRRNEALERLAFLIGDWDTEGTHPLVPGTVLRGRTSFSWHEGGAFLIMRSQIDHPDFPDGVAIVASDEGSGELTLCWFDERGVSRLYSVEAGDGELVWRRDDPAISQTNRIVAEDRDRMRSYGRISENGGTWSDDLSLVYRRASAR